MNAGLKVGQHLCHPVKGEKWSDEITGRIGEIIEVTELDGATQVKWECPQLAGGPRTLELSQFLEHCFPVVPVE